MAHALRPYRGGGAGQRDHGLPRPAHAPALADPDDPRPGAGVAIGIVVAATFVLVVLPAALVLFGRWVFWPRVPHVGRRRPRRRPRLWRRVGDRVSRRPARVHHRHAGAAGRPGRRRLQVEHRARRRRPVPRASRRRSPPPSGSASRSRPALTDPTQVLTRDDPGRSCAAWRRPTASSSARVTDGQRRRADRRGPRRRARLRRRPQAIGRRCATRVADFDDTHVGGTEAEAMDERPPPQRDRLLILPLILLLRARRAARAAALGRGPAAAGGTVLATYAAAMGASWWIFTEAARLRGDRRPGCRCSRSSSWSRSASTTTSSWSPGPARRPSSTAPATGMLRALTATGGVITSAGILLAAVFAVLGVLPLVVLAQLGTIICVGVLLDTLRRAHRAGAGARARPRRPLLVAAEGRTRPSPAAVSGSARRGRVIAAATAFGTSGWKTLGMMKLGLSSSSLHHVGDRLGGAQQHVDRSPRRRGRRAGRGRRRGTPARC